MNGDFLFDVMVSLSLVALNGRRATFVHPVVSCSILDLTFAFPGS